MTEIAKGPGVEQPEEQGGLVVDCEETIETLYTYLDGELTEERRMAISAHLDQCPPCLHIVGFEAELRRVIADRCRDHVPDALRARIAEALDEADRSRAED